MVFGTGGEAGHLSLATFGHARARNSGTFLAHFSLQLGRRQADAAYARLAFMSATRMVTRLPSALAARVMVLSVTETWGDC